MNSIFFPKNRTLETVKSDTPEEVLVEHLKDADTASFRILFERYQPTLFRHVLYRAHSVDLAHDIVQETFLRVWEHRSSLDPRLSFLAYLFRISGNLIRDHVKHRQTRDKYSDLLPLPERSEGDDPGEALQLTLLLEALHGIVEKKLPDRCREVFLLSRIEGKSNGEIAELFNLSVRTVEHQIARALKILRKHIPPGR